MSRDIFAQANAAANDIRQRSPFLPRIAVVLGSGLGAFAEQMEATTTIPYSAIPHFPQSTVPGHIGRLVLGTLGAVPIAIMQGRVHGYEGYSPEEVVFPVRVLAHLGVQQLIVTNAAGGVHPDLVPGQLVLLSDHINFTGSNPLVGANDERLGPRFFDMTEAYSRRLRALAHQAAAAESIVLTEGVYLGLSGPSYETPAEIRAFRVLGADLVGMSTVHEVIAARHLGLEVLGLSCVTNMAAGMTDGVIYHEEVIETGLRVAAQLNVLLSQLVGLMDGAVGPGGLR